METIEFKGMDRLATSVEQAKIIGIIKEPEQIVEGQKSNLIVYGAAIAGTFIFSLIIILIIIEKNNQKQEN